MTSPQQIERALLDAGATRVTFGTCKATHGHFIRWRGGEIDVATDGLIFSYRGEADEPAYVGRDVGTAVRVAIGADHV